ncbi:MAG: DUF885 domain-containing protein [Deltaproteobacteria bacterium]|nr:DUF885 domain-containing protein [Deltaproteobacteria bacterium]
MKSRAVSLILAAALLWAGCAGTGGAGSKGRIELPDAEAPPAEGLAALADAWWEASMRRSPTWATSLGDRRFDALLPDLSDASREAFHAQVRRLLDAARALDVEALDASARVTRDALVSTLERELQSEVCSPWLWDVDQLTGPQVWLPQIPGYHTVRSDADLGTLLKRYAAIPGYLAAHRAQLERGLAQGYQAPRVIVERVLAQLDRLVDAPAAGSPFLVLLRLPVGWHNAKAEAARAQVAQAVTTQVLPALRAYRDFIRTLYLPRARSSIGVDGLPDGAACYAALIRDHTGTTLAPDAIHELGMAELSSIHAEMRAIALAELSPPPPPPKAKKAKKKARRARKPKKASRRKRKGEATGRGSKAEEEPAAAEAPAPAPAFEGDPIAAYRARLEADPTSYARSEDELLAFARQAVARAESKLPLAFRRLPRVPVEVRAIEPFRADEAPAAYYYGAPDDHSRPAVYYVNTSHLEERPLYHQEALAFHEAVPGHHLQISVAAAADLPAFQRHMRHTAFTEGWALYAERLAGELALYSSPASRFGALGYQAWRAARLVVDVGIHARGWTRDQATRFLVDNTTLTPHEAGAEVDRYIAWPAQALSYTIGRMHFERLRRQAESELCVRFDLPRFHEEILRYGAVPPEVLDGVVDRYIQGFYEEIIP